jgi:hypothetical protein
VENKHNNTNCLTKLQYSIDVIFVAGIHIHFSTRAISIARGLLELYGIRVATPWHVWCHPQAIWCCQGVIRRQWMLSGLGRMLQHQIRREIDV